MNKQSSVKAGSLHPFLFCLGVFFLAATFSIVTCFSIFSAVGTSGSSSSYAAKAPVQQNSLAVVR
jgi:hypothetical protein